MNESIGYVILALAIVVGALAVIGWYQIRKLKASIALDNSDVKAEVNARLNRKIEATENLATELNSARVEEIAKVRDETPRCEINAKNEAVLYTRTGQQIHNYKLSKK